MLPHVNEDTVVSTAGQPLTVECMFQIIDNLIKPPIVLWINSAGSVLSDTSTLSFSPLLTSHGGEYTCNVTINIPELNILLSGEGNSRITVQSNTFTTLHVFCCCSCLCSHFLQFPLRLLSLKKLVHHSMVQSTFSHVL